MSIHDKIVKINIDNPQPELIKKASDIIHEEGLVCIPTRCLYGLAASAFSADAVNKIYRVKKRLLSKPILVFVHDYKEIEKIVKHVPDAAKRIIDKFWPGKITIIFEAKDIVLNNISANTGKIGIRIPENKVAFALVNKLKIPITGTSANISNETGVSSVEKLETAIKNAVDLIIDAGQLKEGIGSTIIDVTVEPPKILREGVIKSQDIFEVLLK
ncbi:MAG: threonylcarbamoyl-AMP synthase [Desulfobacterales bacterium]|nr:threonylcarbamoyl-AMP synthase [Desulfobacterales bacterium]